MRRAMIIGTGALLGLGLAGSTWAQGDEVTPICAIQGAGRTSPFAGSTVTTEGIVTADLVETEQNGFFLQQPNCDDDPATSDGIWVYDGPHDVAVDDGALVRVTGQVREYYGLTEIMLDAAATVGQGELPDPNKTIIAIPRDPQEADAYLEAHEGMWVTIPASRVVAATNSHGEAYVMPWDSGVTRVFRRNIDSRMLGLVFPGFRYPLWHGDGLAGIQGPLTYTFGQYKMVVWPPDGPERGPGGVITPPEFQPSGPDELTIATYNLANFFDPVDDPGKNDTEWTPTSEEYEAEVARRARSIGVFLGAPDLVAVQEAENLAVLQALADHPHPALAAAEYSAVLLEGPDLRGIDVGLLYKRSRLRVLSSEQRQACTALDVGEPNIDCPLPDGTSGHALFGRPPLVVRLEAIATGARLTLIVNHFKSKSGGDEATAPIRLAMADHVLEVVRDRKAAEPGTPVIVLGDLNDFEDAPPILRLTADGLLRDLHAQVPPPEDYSYIYNGVGQILDFILVEPDQPVLAFGPAHINVDFPHPHDPFDAVTARASDHDPLILRIPLLGGRVFLPLLARQPGPEIDARSLSRGGPGRGWGGSSTE